MVLVLLVPGYCTRIRSRKSRNSYSRNRTKRCPTARRSTSPLAPRRTPSVYAARRRAIWIVRAVSDRTLRGALGEWQRRKLASRIVAARGWPAGDPRHAALVDAHGPQLPMDFGPPNSTVSACDQRPRLRGVCVAVVRPGVQARCFATPAAPLSTAAADASAPFCAARSPRKGAKGVAGTSAGGHAGSPLAGARRKRPHGASTGRAASPRWALVSGCSSSATR